jgi:hypothetical protein
MTPTQWAWFFAVLAAVCLVKAISLRSISGPEAIERARRNPAALAQHRATFADFRAEAARLQRWMWVYVAATIVLLGLAVGASAFSLTSRHSVRAVDRSEAGGSELMSSIVPFLDNGSGQL